MSGPPTQATNSVLNLVNPEISKIKMDSTSPAGSDPYSNGINLNNAPLYNLRTPVLDHEAVSKDYVDSATLTPGAGLMSPWLSLVGNIPEGWLLCDGTSIGAPGTGAALEDAEFETLFNLIKYAAPNSGTEVWGVNTVNLPNFRGRTPVGLDTSGVNMDANAGVLGDVNGSYEHTLSLGEMPTHSHTGSTDMTGNHAHAGSTTGGTGDHTHQTVASSTHNHTGTTNISPTINTPASGIPTINVSGELHTHTFTTGGPSGTTAISGGSHSHSISIATDGDHMHTLSITSEGSSNAHYNMQPYLVVYWIIAYK